MSYRVISVPLTAEAIARLDYDRSVEGDCVELILDDAQSKLLWGTGVLDALNAALGCHIEDYEDDQIAGDADLALAEGIVRQYATAQPDAPILADLLKLVEVAINARTSIVFFF